MAELRSCTAVFATPEALSECELYYSEALVDREQALGGTHTVALLALGNYGHVLAAQGRPSEAEPLLREEMAGWKETAGPSHPSTLQATLALGRVLVELEQAREAEALARGAMLHASASGNGMAKQPYQLAITSAAASVMKMAGHKKEAEALLRKALQQSRDAAGPGDPCTLAVAQALADCAGATADAAKAVQSASASWTAQVPENAPNSVTIATDMVTQLLRPRWVADENSQLRFLPFDLVVSSSDVLTQLQPILTQALEHRRDAMGEEDAGTLTALGNLAACQMVLGDYAAATAGFRKQLAGQRAACGEDAVETLDSKANLARTLEAAGELDEAKRLFTQVADAAARAGGGATSRAVLVAVFNLARCEKALGDTKGAEWRMRQSQQACVNELGYTHLHTVVCTFSLAQFLQELERIDEADALLGEMRDSGAATAETMAQEAPVALCMPTSLQGVLYRFRP